MASRLPRSFPSVENVDPAGISAFLNALGSVELHSLMLLRHGRVIAEAWWRPYVADEVQLGFSLSKSLVSVALSYVIDDGLISLDQPVVEVLGEVPDDPRYRLLTIRDLARMTTGHHTSPEIAANWPPLDEEPGHTWIYNNWATFTLARVIQQVTGSRMTDLLERRLFEQLDIEDWAWLRHEGVELGFSGLHLSTESWAKFGHLLLRGGELWDRQVISQAWLDEATRAQADTSEEPDGSPRDSGPDGLLGYGYQFWVSKHGFRAAGIHGQLIVVLPEQDLVLVTTAAAPNSHSILPAVWEHLLPAVGPDRRGNPCEPTTPGAADLDLARQLSSLGLPPVASQAADQAGVFTPAPGPQVAGEVQRMFVTEGDRCWNLDIRLEGQDVQLVAGDGSWIENQLPVTGCDPMRIGVSAGWTSEDRFVVEVRPLHVPHAVEVVCDSSTGLFCSGWLNEVVGGPATLTLPDLAVPAGIRHRIPTSTAR